uniref:Uncharacterized protein n=1 Tax=uncultured Armatimonadetes bacterium TaxID=157466 RepID=A0A6J4HL82_9BACT|nr:hypothetical protein AVDCRST_MAG63-785 [uncultured Armatimonadetes bacterium]
MFVNVTRLAVRRARTVLITTLAVAGVSLVASSGAQARAIWGEARPSRAIWGEAKPSRAIWGEARPSRAIWGEARPSRAIWGELAPAYSIGVFNPYLGLVLSGDEEETASINTAFWGPRSRN